MSKLLYDNIDDAVSKLSGTIIYYGKQPVVVKQVQYDEDDPDPVGNKKFQVVCTKTLTGRSGHQIAKLNDPLLNYKRFNLGYANYEHGSVWWYRKPVRQYRQGLKNDQLKYLVGEGSIDFGFGFQPSKPIEAMLTNMYPDKDEILKFIIDSPGTVRAIHKDLAVKWDKVHQDMVLEYKGRLIGCTDKNFSNIKLMDDHKYLTETVQEVFGVH